MTLKTKYIKLNLCKKGFAESNTDHKVFCEISEQEYIKLQKRAWQCEIIPWKANSNATPNFSRFFFSDKIYLEIWRVAPLRRQFSTVGVGDRLA
jgi:hypothetical protein